MELDQIINLFHPAALAAYQSSSAAVLPAGFAYAARIQSTSGEDFGFVAFNAANKTALVAIRGTEDLADWVHDIDALPVLLYGVGSGLVHHGFLTSYLAIRASILDAIVSLQPDSIWITGHSLGGALAMPCARDLALFNLEVVTFAAPRFGDSAFASWFNQHVRCTRVVNRCDLVPQVPTDPPYRHAGSELVVEGGYKFFDPRIAHSLAQYLTGLKKLVPVPSC